MRTARELEKELAKEPVRLAAPNGDGSGILSLNKRQTSVTITTSEQIKKRDPGTGWFDLPLEQTNGSKILLHNALITSFSRPHPDRRMKQLSIFPNVVVLNAEHILPQGRVREIRFTARGLENIFHYETTEGQSLYQAPSRVMRSLRELRKLKASYPRQYDYFAPGSLYLIHDLPRVFRVRVDDRTYDIFMGCKEAHSLNSIKIESQAIATIRFDSAVSIDDALDAAWAWQRFFSQIAMRPLPFLSLSCRAKISRAAPSSELYLPNLRDEGLDEDQHFIEFGPADVPYGEWRKRAKFGEAMRGWLSSDSTRRLFRVRVHRVLERMHHESSTALIAQLCSAIESLPGVGKLSDIRKDDLDTIVTAASTAAGTLTPPISKDRIRGILSLLQHQSLGQRLGSIAAALEPSISAPDARALIKSALSLRNFEAHGGSRDAMTAPLVRATLDALASFCVLWDLTSSGLPEVSKDRRLAASRRLAWSIRELTASKSGKSEIC